MANKYKKIAYSFVIADLLHYGHIKLLETAKRNADYHICGLISDDVSHIWQGINVCNYEERKAVIKCLNCVDEVMEQKSIDPTENLKVIKGRYPQAKFIVVHGDDWKTIPGREYMESIDAKIIQPEYYAQLSRDKIIKKFRQTTPQHPLKHEYFTRDFSVGNIVHFSSQGTSKLISTKANTLKIFKSILNMSKIEKLFVCTTGELICYQEDILKSIRKQFKGKIIVRSSCFNEDGLDISNAGCFQSVSNVDSQNREELTDAIKTVIKSYEKADSSNPKNQVLIQNQTTNVKKSGVIFTHNLETNTPYYVINYDDVTGKTDTVTGGEESKCLWVYKNENISSYPKKWQKLLIVIREIENKLPGMILDIEFAEKVDGTIIIYQIRPLAANIRCEEISDEMFKSILDRNIEKYKKNPEKINNSKSFLSDMAFWNPSEIIGDNPHPLDYSIYREIITRSAWNTGLTNLGYSHVKHELMDRYGNKPYINLDYAFYSLLPASLDKRLKHKLKEYFKKRLRRDLTAHDKIEFEIVLSCYDFETEKKLQKLYKYGFSDNEVIEISKALKSFTCSIIQDYRNIIKRYLRDLKKLKSETDLLAKESKKERKFSKYINNFLGLLKYISEFGTPQFSAVARMAFISKSLCKSLVNMGHFSDAEMNSFLGSISTVATEFDLGFRKHISGLMTKREFFKRYGHLRAGTYDIRAMRYDQSDLSELMNLSNTSAIGTGPPKKKNDLDMIVYKNKLKTVLNNSVFTDISPEDFIYFLKSSVEQREYFKFEFTRSLSEALEFLTKAGEHLGFSREDLSFLDMAVIRSIVFYAEHHDIVEAWRMWIEKSKSIFIENSRLVLPPVIKREADFKIINMRAARPNFISQHCVVGETVDLGSDNSVDITEKIVILTKADPGYDWIFTRNIKGLITKFGGAASHIAIRCAEFNIPAAIGCGEQIYSKISKWKKLELDCKTKKIRPVINYNA
jgi:cytidyltransferase-like protein